MGYGGVIHVHFFPITSPLGPFRPVDNSLAFSEVANRGTGCSCRTSCRVATTKIDTGIQAADVPDDPGCKDRIVSYMHTLGLEMHDAEHFFDIIADNCEELGENHRCKNTRI